MEHQKTTFNVEAIKARVLSLVFKPFATDVVRIGTWAIAAHTCGYYLTSEGGFRFSFAKTEVDTMLEVLAGILDSSLKMATYSNGAAGVYHKGEYRRVNDIRGSTPGDCFTQALEQLKLIAKRRGQKSCTYETLLAVVVFNEATT